MSGRELPAVLQLLSQLGPALDPLDRAKLKGLIEQLVALRAPIGGQWPSLAQMADSIGEVHLARDAIDLFVEQSGATSAALYQRATFLAHTGAWTDADKLLRELPATVPNPTANAYSRGIAALNLGKLDEARSHLEAVTAARPQTGSAWLALVMAVDVGREPALGERIIAAERTMESAAPAERAALHYALGEVHAKRHQHAAAFDAFARGAQQMKAVVRFDRGGDRAEAAEAVRGFSSARIAAIARRQSEPSGRAIFVTGLPRSGTTLVEQILTSHGAVDSGAEMSGLAMLAMEIGGRSYPALSRFADEKGAASAASLWRHLLDERFPATGRIVDKSVISSRFLGIAAALLPEAPLIWVTRDPLDRAWSCFRTNFMGGALPWSYDLEDIAAHFRVEDELLVQWKEILGERLLVVPYEELVAGPEGWIRRILAHCGLAEEAQVFAPHLNSRPVATASMMQVRRPINRGSIGSAEPYRAFLQPFERAYFG
jgi:hypothetical protein